jgi:hypothetical protein
MKKRAILLLVGCTLTFLGKSGAQEWKNVGTLTSSPILATGRYTPTGTQPFWRGWTRPVYDPVHKKLLLYWANPNCCGGTFSNAMFYYDTAERSWSLAWSHETMISNWNIVAISRSNGLVSASLKGSPKFSVGDPVLVRGVSDNSFNGTYVLANVTGSDRVVWKQPGRDTASKGGMLLGPGDRIDAPADRHTYHLIVWDSKRNVLWTGFGSAVVGGAAVTCGDCGISDFYKFDTSTKNPTWTETCGYGTIPCPANLRLPQEAAAAYDATNDVIVVYGGLSGSATAVTWAYYPASNRWTEVCGGLGLRVCGPPELNGESMTPMGDGKLLLFGGSTAHGAILDQTWIFDTASMHWKQAKSTLNPPAAKFPVMGWVPRLKRVVLIGNESSGAHVWSFDPHTAEWQDLRVSPGPILSNTYKQNQGAYDPNADRFVVFTSGEQGPQIWNLTLPTLKP